MKKRILVVATVLLCITAHSQINKGSKFLGGGLNFSSASSDNSSGGIGGNSHSSSKYLSVGPTAGYFIKDNLAIGLSLAYNYSSAKNFYSTSSSSTINNMISVIPYARYYFNLGEKAAVFTQLGAGYAFGNSNNLSTKTKSTEINTSLLPGFSYFLSNKCALEATIGNIGYSLSQTKSIPSSGNVQTATSSNFNFSLSMSTINLGFKYFIRK